MSGDAGGFCFRREAASAAFEACGKAGDLTARITETGKSPWRDGATHVRVGGGDGEQIGRGDKPEVFRSNMPNGPITYATLASTAVGNADETRFYWIPIDPASLQKGTNLLAVEIHQSGTNSTDIAFDLALQAQRLQPPRLAIDRAPDEVQLSWPGYAEGLDLYSATNLISPVIWDPITTSPSLSNGLRTITLPVVPNVARFYRLATP